MGHTPYGYRIENGKAIVDETAAEQVRKLYAGYLEGLSLKDAAKEAEINCYHATAGRMLQDCYCQEKLPEKGKNFSPLKKV